MSAWQWRHGKNPTASGKYLVVDKLWHCRSIGYYLAGSRPAMGWSIHGRWVGHDAVEAWDYLPDLPPLPESR
jgi:hypothetical protein